MYSTSSPNTKKPRLSISFEVENVMERRLHARITLKEPIACTCRIGDEEPMSGFINNVGIMGVMVELPELSQKLTMECCQPIVIEVEENSDGSLFANLSGTVNWIYKAYIGVGLDRPIRETQQELMEWLEANEQYCEEVC